MTPTLTGNTQAILLLTAPLLSGSAEPSPDLLTPGEYKRLALRLRELQRQPSDLLEAGASALVQDCQDLVDPVRLQRLLERGFQLSQGIDRWQSRAIWVISRADAAYPRRLKTTLREDAPAVLYGCGEISLLDQGGLAVVGSRNADPELLSYAERAGRLSAVARRVLISGGAKGIDQAAMRGSLGSGGRAVGMLADSLERASLVREHRSLLMEERLVLVSPYDPGAGFNVGHAMQRNRLIYVLADAALVVNADFQKGGTWAGAVEQLDKLRLVPVYVRTPKAGEQGMEGLRRKGARLWPEPCEISDLAALLSEAFVSQVRDGGAIALPFNDDAQPVSEPIAMGTPRQRLESIPSVPQASAPEATPASPKERLLETARRLVQGMQGPIDEKSMAESLGLEKSQAKAWLRLFQEEGIVKAPPKKGRRPKSPTQQPPLFEEPSTP